MRSFIQNNLIRTPRLPTINIELVVFLPKFEIVNWYLEEADNEKIIQSRRYGIHTKR